MRELIQRSLVLHCKTTGKPIYQMSYLHKDRLGSEPITDDGIVEAVRKFLDELHALQAVAIEEQFSATQWVRQ